jgi:hypothetical protein
MFTLRQVTRPPEAIRIEFTCRRKRGLRAVLLIKGQSCPRFWQVGTTGCVWWVYLLGVFTSSVKM